MNNVLLLGELVTSNNYLLHLANKLHLASPERYLGVYNQGLPIPQSVDFIWGTNSGLRVIPLLLIQQVMHWLFGSNAEQGLILIAVFLPFIGFYLAWNTLRNRSIWSFIGALLYSFNPWIIGRLFSTGFWQLNLAYSMLPYLILAPEYIMLRAKKLRQITIHVFIYAMCLTFVFIGQPHYFIVIATFIIPILFNKSWIKAVKFLILSFVLFFLWNLYVFIPGIFWPEVRFNEANRYFSLVSVLFNGMGSQWQDILRLMPRFWPFQQAKEEWFSMVQYLTLPTIFTVGLFRPNRRNIYLLTLLALYIFLAKGINGPLGNVGVFLYTSVVFLHYFREPSRLLAGVMLVGALLVSGIQLKLNKYVSRLVITLIVLFAFVTAVFPYERLIQNALMRTKIPDRYSIMQRKINTLVFHGRLLIIPGHTEYKDYDFFFGNNQPSSNTLFSMVYPVKIPLANSSYYPDSNGNLMTERYLGNPAWGADVRVLNAFGVEYVLIDTSVNKKQEIQTWETFANSKLQYVTDLDGLRLYKNDNFSSTITNETPIFAIGDYTTILDAKRRNITSPIILLNQPLNLDKIYSNDTSKFIYVDERFTLDDLLNEYLARSYEIDLLSAAENLNQGLSNCEPYKASYDGFFTSGRCVRSGLRQQDTTIIQHKIEQDNYQLILKAMSYGTANKIEIMFGDNLFTYEIPQSNEPKWMTVAPVSITKNLKNFSIKVQADRQIVIDYMSLIPQVVYKREREILLNKFNSRTRNVNLLQAEIFQPQTDNTVTSTEIRINQPTKYLSYKFTYGKYWKTNSIAQQYMSDGYGMTFMSNQNSISSLYYLPDRYYPWLLGLSVTAFTLSIILLLVSHTILNRY